MKPTIRPIAPGEFDALRTLSLRLHETLRPLDSDLAPGEEMIGRYFARMQETVRETGGEIFVALAGDRLVGYVCVYGSVRTDELDERQDPHGFMVELYVEPEFRNDGLGGQLVERAEKHALALGAYKIELNVLARNEGAIRFYEQLGYAARVVTMAKRLETRPVKERD